MGISFFKMFCMMQCGIPKSAIAILLELAGRWHYYGLTAVSSGQELEASVDQFFL